MKDLTPKQWIKKYCKKDYVICDGMTDAMTPLDLLQTILIIGGVMGVLGFVAWKVRKWCYSQDGDNNNEL